ncbi:MAG: molybdopterin-dependent oxidoreductase [Nitrospirota bacterium]
MSQELISITTDKANVQLTIDDEVVNVPEGTSIYDAIVGMGKTIPSMCYHYTFNPFGSCGVCLVEVEGKKAPVRSCTSPVAAGMIVRVDNKAMFDARKKAVEKHLQTHPLDCPVCDADGHCELQDMSFNFGIVQIGEVKQKGLPEDRRSTVLDFNMNRCILCAQCINICKEVVMVDALQFFKKGGFTHVVAKGDNALDCEFCGDCLAVCPVGAITNKFSKYLYKPWQLNRTVTACNYCADGCQMRVEVKDDAVVRVTSQLSWKDKWDDHTSTVDGHGGLCVKGRFGFAYVNSPDRLKKPLMRKGGKLVESSWFEATADIAKRLRAIKNEHGPDAIAGLITARCTNEDLYAFQRFMRQAVGTNNIDSSARYGHAVYVEAMERALGVVQPTLSFRDLTMARSILVVGSDLTETNPILALRVKDAFSNFHAQLIVTHSMRTNLAKLAPYPYQVAVGSEGAFVQGLTKAIVEGGLVPARVTSEQGTTVSALTSALAGLSWDALRAATGLSREQFAEAASVFLSGDTRAIVLGEQIVNRPDGYANVLRIADLMLVSGMVGQPGSGVVRTCEENNERGAMATGTLAGRLPGGFRYDDPAARARIESAWGATLPTNGATLTEMLDGIRAGRIKALYAVGENPLGTLPASAGVREALAKLDLLIVQDAFLTEMGAAAHVVLPAALAAEKSGTFLDGQGSLQPVVRALDPPGEARIDWEIFSELGQLLGASFDYTEAEEIRRELLQVAPAAFELPGATHPAAGLTADAAARYARPAVAAGPASAESPFELSLYQVLYHSGKMSTRDKGLLEINAKKLLQISPKDAEALGVGNDGRVKVTSPLGSVEVGVEINLDLPAGSCRFPEHFNNPAVKDVLAMAVDPVTKSPVFKAGRVKIVKVG